MEKDREKQESEENVNHSLHIAPMEPLTHGAYGGGMYGTEPGGEQAQRPSKPPASDTQSADGPDEKRADQVKPKHPPPPSTGDRDLDITGQSYIQ
ncbi:hypothetical protein Tsubulata_038203 [Turnera subulata]|uniref:Uncharacterized protein n=1 Tax=Turnera subulata TaxID=218843 RepID=A0A9Q0J0J8_9ROSI|nr:hypothetical protein Tsubulata_038203 [Turnera subulata]